jgi:DNA replication protein DnaC
VELFEQIRKDRRVEGVSIRELAGRHHVHRRTVRQALDSAVPPPRKGYPQRPRPAIDAYASVVDGWLLADRQVPRKQRHTARRIWQRLVAEHGATRSEVTVSRYVARRIAEARFPRIKRLADFNPDAIPGIAAALATLAAGAWIDAGEPVVLLGDSGTGKTHLLIGLGLAACEQGRRVRYSTTAQLVNELAEAVDQRQLSRVVGRYGRLDLLLLDELGYVQLDPRGAELLFQIITEREERASIAIGTNLPFSEWGTVFPDPRLVAAIVDRVTFNAHIVETGTQSYRLATSKTSNRKRAS